MGRRNQRGSSAVRQTPRDIQRYRTPDQYHTSEQFYTAAQATGTAEGLLGRKPIHHHSAIGLHDAVYLQVLDIRHTQSANRCRPWLVDDTDSVIGRRPVCVGVSPTGGYTQGIAASSQAYTDNVSAVVCGEIDPIRELWEHMIDFAYRIWRDLR